MSNSDINKKITIGLTGAEVKEKTEQGLVNGTPDIKTKSYGQIVKDNGLNLFNCINIVLLVCILITGSLKNATFFIIVVCNFFIGVIQEIRAKKAIERLSLLSAPKAMALRDGKLCQIEIKDIVLGEIIQLKNGNQISADGIVIDGECQVNESFITGETTPVTKKPGDRILSGSFLVSGRILAETEHVGHDNYVNRITIGAKRYKKSFSVIMNSVKMIVRIIAIALIPLAGFFIWTNFFRVDQTFNEAMIRTVAGISAMIPIGLILLVSMVLAVSVVRLSQHKTLVQDLYCVENLARIDVLCLDKTGTITEGVMSVEEIIAVGGNAPEDVRNAIRDFALNIDDENSTLESIRKHFGISEEDLSKRETAGFSSVAFSSDRKWSMLRDKAQGISYVLGAPEFVCHEEYEKQRGVIEEYASRAKRVLLFARTEKPVEGNVLPGDLEAFGLIVTGDKIKADAAEVFGYFAAEDVKIKVISGDNPVTVSEVAKEVGIENAESYVNAEELDSYEKILDAAEKYTVFGRVTPYQKLDLVKALKECGHTVAMTGDGANDCLALKEADCSIAMQSGSEAARNIANLVMVDSNFASLPLVLAEGRKSINNLQRSASLFFTKTTYAFILAVIFVVITHMPYPFENIQISLIGGITIGVPSFFLALEPNKNRIKNNFLFNVLKTAIPTGILTVAGMLVTAFICRHNLALSQTEISTATSYIAMIMGIIVVFDICGKLNLWKSVLVLGLIGLAVAALLVIPEFLSFVPLSAGAWEVIIIVAAAFFAVHFTGFRILMPKLEAGKIALRR